VLFKEHGSSDYHVETWNIARAADTDTWSATRADRVSVTTWTRHAEASPTLPSTAAMTPRATPG
jgi:hypothetical protein